MIFSFFSSLNATLLIQACALLLMRLLQPRQDAFVNHLLHRKKDPARKWW